MQLFITPRPYKLLQSPVGLREVVMFGDEGMQ